MSEKMWDALRSAAASSAMEGLPLNDDSMQIVESILEGKMTLQDYFDNLRAEYQE